MLKEKVIKLNWEVVEEISKQINKDDFLQIFLPNGEVIEEKIKDIKLFKPVIVVFNKPKWYVVSKEDKYNKTIFDILPKSWKKDFYYIWRLDKICDIKFWI